MYIGVTGELAKLPSPLEVYWFISEYKKAKRFLDVLPSPREVDRFISEEKIKFKTYQ